MDQPAVFFRRFPLTILGCIGVTGAMILPNNDALSPLSLAFWILMCWGIGVDVWVILQKDSRWRYPAGVLIAAAAWTPLMGRPMPPDGSHYVFVFLVGLALFFAAFVQKADSMRSALSGLTLVFLDSLKSIVLGIILSATILAIFLTLDKVLGVKVPERMTERFLALIWFGAIPLVFLHMLSLRLTLFPIRSEALDTFVGNLRQLTRTILIPGTLALLCLILVHVGQILVNKSWPNGTISVTVIAYGLLTLAAFFLARTDPSPRIHRVIRGLLIGLGPCAILLFMALAIRVREYGWSEDRILLATAGLLLGLCSLLYGFLQVKNAALVFWASAGLLALLHMPGLHRRELSIRSQLDFAREFLQTHPEGTLITENEKQRFRSIMSYLFTRGATPDVEAILPESGPERALLKENREKFLASVLHEEWKEFSPESRFNFQADGKDGVWLDRCFLTKGFDLSAANNAAKVPLDLFTEGDELFASYRGTAVGKINLQAIREFTETRTSQLASGNSFRPFEEQVLSIPSQEGWSIRLHIGALDLDYRPDGKPFLARFSGQAFYRLPERVCKELS